MFTVKPLFYDDFVCKADKCTDTCCAGWEIDVDDIAMNKYRAVCGDFADRLQDGTIYADEVYSFRLKENERCWFLAENGLCDIYSNLGQDFLCDICREHPRFYNCYENVEETGLGLCCERACELLFQDNKPFDICVDGDVSNDDYNKLFILRNKCFEILRDHDNLLCDNICRLLMFASEVQENFFDDEFSFAEYENKAELFATLLSLYAETEPVNQEWTQLLELLTENLDDIVAVSDKVCFQDIYYEKTISYIIYRHLIEAAFCGNFIGGVTFSVSGAIFIHMINCLHFNLHRSFTTEDMINSVKLWSKQTEYSQENTDFLIDKTIGLFFN